MHPFVQFPLPLSALLSIDPYLTSFSPTPSLQEAFKAIEEIHNLITISKHKAKSSLLENFYQKQASVYWMANNKLFHAAALQRLFILRKEHKKTFSLDSEEARK